jgi:hypothetical protein
MGAEVRTRNGKPVWKDVCDSCYRDIVKDCQLCHRDDLMPSDVSAFILVKTELGRTDRRPPGIYRVARHPFLSILILVEPDHNPSNSHFSRYSPSESVNIRMAL